MLSTRSQLCPFSFFCLSFLRKQESRVPDENRDPGHKIVPGFRRDNVWIPVFTGMTILTPCLFTCSWPASFQSERKMHKGSADHCANLASPQGEGFPPSPKGTLIVQCQPDGFLLRVRPFNAMPPMGWNKNIITRTHHTHFCFTLKQQTCISA